MCVFIFFLSCWLNKLARQVRVPSTWRPFVVAVYFSLSCLDGDFLVVFYYYFFHFSFFQACFVYLKTCFFFDFLERQMGRDEIHGKDGSMNRLYIIPYLFSGWEQVKKNRRINFWNYFVNVDWLWLAAIGTRNERAKERERERERPLSRVLSCLPQPWADYRTTKTFEAIGTRWRWLFFSSSSTAR